MDEFPVNCKGIEGTPVDLSDIPFPEPDEGEELVGGVDMNIECRLPQCSWGLPLGKRLQVCVTAGEFEFENCFALDSLQPLASDPRGLRVSDVEVGLVGSGDFSDTVYLCGLDKEEIVIRGDVKDLLGYYKGVTGLGIYDTSSGLRKAVYPGIDDDDIVMVKSDGITITDPKLEVTVALFPPFTNQEYLVKAFTGTYYETPGVDSDSFFVSTGSGCTINDKRCSGIYEQTCQNVGVGCIDFVNTFTCSGPTGATCTYYDGCLDGFCTDNASPENIECFVGGNKRCDGVSKGDSGCAWQCTYDSDCGTGSAGTCTHYTGDCTSTSHSCDIVNDDPGTACGSDFCDGAGSCSWDCLSNSDCDDNNACTDDTCSGHTCSNPVKPAGTVCGCDFCNGAGSCSWDCMSDGDCVAGQLCDTGAHTCYTPGPVCGNGACEPASGENCGSCASDCICGTNEECKNNVCIASGGF